MPDQALPDPLPPAPPVAALGPVMGKGMFLWQIKSTEGGDLDAIVPRAAAAGLQQLWVRVGDSQDGFYAAAALARLVPAAHRRGIAVVGWGFPYLYDPLADASWSAAALAWRAPDGSALDAFSPDIEMEAEGTLLSERRAGVYLGHVQRAAGGRPLVATVYRPSDQALSRYPYGAIAPYVDAFAPMVYWGCTEPGQAAQQAIERLAALRPVHLIGQAYNMADEGGRQVSPSAEETWRFLDVAQLGGAVGASFWVWQSMTPEEWGALSDFSWPRERPPSAHG